ncbi:hypothetical protein BDW22DRAFT_1487049 [Trametopsis cervina]|nr:hypothetical protein BDW22DRAFT_1487049 [Trametopsis cervina]
MPFRPTAPLYKKTSKSSTLWLARQYKDPYVRARLSNPVNYRSRSAFKLLEVEARFGFLKAFMKEAQASVAADNKGKSTNRKVPRTFNVVDLGAAPGGWSQVISAKLGLYGDDVDEAPTRRKPKSESHMAEWKEEIDKRKERKKILEDHVEEEIDELDSLLEEKTQKGWSTPPPSKSKKQYGLNKTSTGSEPDFNNMDPFDYLNSRDLDSEAASESTALPENALPINIVALDILPMQPLPGVHSVQMNFLSPDAPSAVTSLLSKLSGSHGSSSEARVDLMLSDLSPPHTGNRTADVSHSVTLLRAVWDFARSTLKTRKDYHLERVRQQQRKRQDAERKLGLTGTGHETRGLSLSDLVGTPVEEESGLVNAPQASKSILSNGGILVLKHFAHPISTAFCRTFLNPYFSKILYFKPPASRSDSSEGYWVCIGWKGVPNRITADLLDEKMQLDVEREMAKEVKTEDMARGRLPPIEVGEHAPGLPELPVDPEWRDVNNGETDGSLTDISHPVVDTQGETTIPVTPALERASLTDAEAGDNVRTINWRPKPKQNAEDADTKRER